MTVLLGIREGDKVLDVGGGFYPFSRAQVVTDISFSLCSERNGTPMLFREGVRYVECPAEDLPFGDKEFDFVFSSHVLEHTEDPEAACREMIRVAKRGFVEVPNEVSDFLCGNPTHRWRITRRGGVLTFQPRNYMESPFRNFLHSFVLRDPEFFDWVYRGFRNILNIQFEWEDRFDFQVFPLEGGGEFRYSDPNQAGLSHLLFAYNNLRFSSPPDFALSDAMEAVRFLPESPEAWHILGIYYVRMLLLDKAHDALSRARELAPGDELISYNLGKVESFKKKSFWDTSQIILPRIGERGALVQRSSPPAPRSLVSVIMTLSPSERDCREGLQTFLTQEYKPTEAILVGEKREEEIQEVLKIGVPKGRLRYVEVPPGTSRGERVGRGMREARGEYIAFLDPETRWHPDHIQKLVKYLELTGEGVVYSDAYLLTYNVTPEGLRYFKWGKELILSRALDSSHLGSPPWIPLSCVVHKKDVLKTRELPDPGLGELLGQDYLFRLSRHGKVCHLKEATAEIRVREADLALGYGILELSEEQKRVMSNYSRLNPFDLARKVAELHNLNSHLQHELEKLQRKAHQSSSPGKERGQ